MATRAKQQTRKSTTVPSPVPIETLAPETTPSEPGRLTVVYLPRSSTGGVRVTEELALTYAAVWACVKVISEDIATLPWHVLRSRSDGGSDPAPEHVVDWLLHTQANPETAAFQWREVIVAHALVWGNGYAEIERDYAGRPTWLWQLTPDRVRVDRDARGRLVYDVMNPGEPNTVLDAEDVYHLKGPSFDGLVGYSVIGFAARVIGGGIAMDTYSSELFANDSTPGGLLEHPGRLSPEARANLRDSWQKLHKGAGNRRVLAILEEGMKWTQTALPPEDARFIESHFLSIEDICRFFRVPPHKIFHLLRSTNNNIEHQSREYVTDAMQPWITRMEGEANLKLFGRQQRGAYYTKMNFKARLRGDTAAQTTHYQQMLDRGVYDINEVREYEDLNPIKYGDKRLVPLNMTTLEKAGEDPPAPESPAKPPMSDDGKMAQDGEGQEKEDGSEASQSAQEDGKRKMAVLKAAGLPILEDACRRILRREVHRTRDALKRLGSDRTAYEGWLNEFLAQHTGYLIESLGPPARVLEALATGAPPVEDGLAAVAVGLYARRHWAGLKTRVLEAMDRPETPDSWEAMAAESAAWLADRVLMAAVMHDPRLTAGD